MMERAIQPSIFGDLHARCAGFHKILCIEVGARRVGRAGRMHNGQMLLLPERLERSEGWMQSEESVEIDHRLSRNVDAGPHRVILRFGMRYNDVQSIGGATLENHDEPLGATAILNRTKGRSGKKAWNGGRPDDGEGAVAKKNAACNGHVHPSSQFSVVSCPCSVS